jgi:GDP-L-fucose synthase
MPANLYGPGDNFNINSGHVLPSLINKFHQAKKQNLENVELWGDGSALREFLHVDDLADAVIFCMQNFDANEHLNIGSGEEVSIKKLAEMIQNVVDFKGLIKWNSKMPNGTPRKILDSSNIRNLGWKSKIELENGIQLTYDWFLSSSEIRD